MLLNWIDTGLYERSGKALTNFKDTVPRTSRDLAQELTKDPYNFAFAGVTKKYNEAQLKERFLLLRKSKIGYRPIEAEFNFCRYAHLFRNYLV